MADFGTVARPYARAVFELAREAGQLDGWSRALAAAAAVVANDDAERALSNPELTDAARVDLVASVAEGVDGAQVLGSEHGRGLLKLLAENDRLAALPEISSQFNALKAQAENTIDVTLVSATAVEGDVTSKVIEALERKLHRKVALTVEVDESLIGGAIIRAEDMVIDGSVRTRLQRLTEALVG